MNKDDANLNVDNIINMIPLSTETNKLAQEIVNEQDIDKVKSLTTSFNLNQAKKNVLRVLKLNSLLDKVTDQMLDRFEDHPDEFSNTDLINYMQTVQGAIDRANKSLNLVNETPAIQINQVNVNTESKPVFDKDSRDKIREAVLSIRKMLEQNSAFNKDIEPDENIIIEEPKENIQKKEPVSIEDTPYLEFNKLNEEDDGNT